MMSMAKTGKKARAANHSRDALPVLTMIVDGDLGIRELNGAARKFLGPDHERVLRMRKGEAFNCAHSQEAPAGCGHGRFCRICPIREAVVLACEEQRVVRRRTTAEVGDSGRPREVNLLVTATPLPSQGSTRILLVLEDIDALVELQKHTPICASCGRIHDDHRYWQQLETHLRNHLDMDLSQGVCPDCSRQFYGNLLGSQPLEFKPQAGWTRARVRETSTTAGLKSEGRNSKSEGNPKSEKV
jgi:hypothetical protein